MAIWVLNASPVICLAKVGQIGLLLQLAEEIILPEAVANEILAGPEGDAARHILSARQLPVTFLVKPREEIMAWDLGAGETAVLSYALDHPGCVAIIDDLSARKCARSYAISHKGTLAVVMQAQKSGLIVSASSVLRSMMAAGLRLDERVIRDALKRVLGEEW